MSVGAGAIHAAAVGVHGEHPAAAVTFALLALAQLGWGVLALRRRRAWLARLGLAVNGAAVGGWVVAKTTGIPFVAGLRTATSPGLPDTLAALLAMAAVAGVVADLADSSWLRSTAARATRLPAAAATAVLVLTGMVATGAHTHAHGIDPGHDHSGSAVDHDRTETSVDHGRTRPDDTVPAGQHDRPGDTVPAGRHDHTGGTPPGPGRRYDATLPVDLSGVPGVTAEQQASAERLVTRTIVNLPQFRDPSYILTLGYRSIGDDVTGYVHYLNWPWLSDGRELDPAHPEALVYKLDYPNGVRTLTLQAAMYMLEPGSTLDTVPDVGGPLVQWHVHRNLCYGGQPNAWRVISVVEPPAPCPAGQFRPEAVPMLHVWIVPQPCGPFAALEGIAGGQIKPGEQVLCDHVHGSV